MLYGEDFKWVKMDVDNIGKVKVWGEKLRGWMVLVIKIGKYLGWILIRVKVGSNKRWND